MATLDEIRATGERELTDLLARLDVRHRAMLRDAIEQFGRVQDIPESVWDAIRADIENEETAALLLLLIMNGDLWTTEEIAQQGARVSAAPPLERYAIDAARRTQVMADQTTATLRDRLARKVEDAMASGPGSVGELTPEGIDEALDDTFTPQRRETIAIDQTTGSLSTGQRGAAQRAGGDGAATADGQSVTIELIWRTERDDRVCPRCSPLEGTTEAVWGRVFPNGPGPEAHPRCRCSLQTQVVVEPAERVE